MESEKVKEIKEKLQEEVELGKEYCLTHRRVGVDDLCDILTLINELEKENARLKSTNTNILKSCDEYKNRHLKQFAEMLKENITIWYPSVIESIDDTLKEFIK